MKKIRDVSNEEMMQIFNDPEKREIFNKLYFKNASPYRNHGDEFTGDNRFSIKQRYLQTYGSEYGPDINQWPDDINWVKKSILNTEKEAADIFERYCRNTKGQLLTHSDYYYLELENIGTARFKQDIAEDLGLIEMDGSIGIDISSDEDLINAGDEEKVEYIKQLEDMINQIAISARKIHSNWAAKGPSYKHGERASEQIVQAIKEIIKNN